VRILTIFAHPNPKSFCQAILDEFSRGLAEAGHTNEVVNLYAIHFDPVFHTQDFASYVHESMPLEILDEMNLKQHVLDTAGGPIQRFAVSLWLRDKDSRAVAKFIHAHRPKDVIKQWEKWEGLKASPLFRQSSGATSLQS
jgi:NAD(P)H dehydrogenase (quinone)